MIYNYISLLVNTVTLVVTYVLPDFNKNLLTLPKHRILH